jgi:hypothetical protein
MKLKIGGYKGTPIPRMYNPLIFVVASIFMVAASVFVLIGAALFLIFAPLSWITVVRVTEK